MMNNEKCVAELRSEWKKGRKNRNLSTIKSLMEGTRDTRNKWIVHERPLISDVLRKFPSLKDSKVVSSEKFKCVGMINIISLASERVLCFGQCREDKGPNL